MSEIRSCDNFGAAGGTAFDPTSSRREALSELHTGESVAAGFIRAVHRWPNRAALEIGGQVTTYAELGQYALAVADGLRSIPDDWVQVGIIARRSRQAYAAVLGVLVTGRTFVPLDPSQPPARNQQILRSSGARVIIGDEQSPAALGDLLDDIESDCLILLPPAASFANLAHRFPRHQFVSLNDLGDRDLKWPQEIPTYGPAYLMFTSGSSGAPKGVPVNHQNLGAYLSAARVLFGLQPDDRVSGFFELTFDLGMHDLFVTWQAGACLCVVPPTSLLVPAKFIKERQLSVWFSVPSVIFLLQRMGRLPPNSFPLLRLSLFCGEPLPLTSAEAWAVAAPNSVVENLYGPTEATIAITRHRFHRAETKTVRQTAPIGKPFPHHRVAVVDEELVEVSRGDAGELCLQGPQITEGYWWDPALTERKFVFLPGMDSSDIWYRTGDRVVADEDGDLHFLGRLDTQIKIHGHRVELEEIDSALRQAAGTDFALAVAVTDDGGLVRQIVGCVVAGMHGGKKNEIEMINKCRNLLPDYMVPNRIVQVSNISRTPTGKLDRASLAESLQMKSVKK